MNIIGLSLLFVVFVNVATASTVVGDEDFNIYEWKNRRLGVYVSLDPPLDDSLNELEVVGKDTETYEIFRPKIPLTTLLNDDRNGSSHTLRFTKHLTQFGGELSPKNVSIIVNNHVNLGNLTIDKQHGTLNFKINTNRSVLTLQITLLMTKRWIHHKPSYNIFGLFHALPPISVSYWTFDEVFLISEQESDKDVLFSVSLKTNQEYHVYISSYRKFFSSKRDSYFEAIRLETGFCFATNGDGQGIQPAKEYVCSIKIPKHCQQYVRLSLIFFKDITGFSSEVCTNCLTPLGSSILTPIQTGLHRNKTLTCQTMACSLDHFKPVLRNFILNYGILLEMGMCLFGIRITRIAKQEIVKDLFSHEQITRDVFGFFLLMFFNTIMDIFIRIHHMCCYVTFHRNNGSFYLSLIYQALISIYSIMFPITILYPFKNFAKKAERILKNKSGETQSDVGTNLVNTIFTHTAEQLSNSDGDNTSNQGPRTYPTAVSSLQEVCFIKVGLSDSKPQTVRLTGMTTHLLNIMSSLVIISIIFSILLHLYLISSFVIGYSQIVMLFCCSVLFCFIAA